MTVFILFILSVCLVAQDPSKKNNFEPYSGQDGKDVVWVPTPQLLVEKMLEMAKVSPEDFVMDLGSGDGRLVITAAKRGARALGVEYNPDMVELSKQNANKEGVSGKADFIQADLFEVDLSKATVITLFLTTHLNLRLRPKLLELKPGTRIVSNTFTMEDWVADESFMIEDDCYSWCNALLWIVPAKVQGTWKLQQGELTLNQEFQVVSGTLKNGRESSGLTGGRMKGNEISFTIKGTEYTGIVNGNTISGTMKSGGTTSKWNATKSAT
jgi:SAM-dependent methyltransferase